MTDFAQFFGRFSKKYSKLFARFQIYIYICTKNVALSRSFSGKLREKKEETFYIFI